MQITGPNDVMSHGEGKSTFSNVRLNVCFDEKGATLCTHGSFPIGFISNWARFSLGSILIAFLPNDLPNWK